MSKGKKFDAAEKHFKEKEVKLKREVNEYKTAAYDLADDVQKLTAKVEELEEENYILKKKVEVLEKCTKLSDDEIQELLSAERRNASIENMMKMMNNHGNIRVLENMFK